MRAGSRSSKSPAPPPSDAALSLATRIKQMSHAIRRVVTGHDDNGKAIVESDGAAPNVKIREGAGFISTLLWVTDETPANVGLRKDRADRTIAVAPPANGSILRVVEFPPVTSDGDKMDSGERFSARGRHARSA